VGLGVGKEVGNRFFEYVLGFSPQQLPFHQYTIYLVTDSVGKVTTEKYNLPVDSHMSSNRKHIYFKVF
jgi:hypothetical protein